MDNNNILIHRDKTIIQALNQLNSITDVSRLILFVKNDDNEVIGSLTDGDIRRAIVKSEDLNETVDAVCNKNFVFTTNDSSSPNLNQYRQKKLKILPVLNKKNELTRIIDLDKTKSLLPVECMIMAGGRGKRLSPLTDRVPKPMLTLGDKPIIEHNIDRLIKYGINKIYISVKYLGEQIEEYFGDGTSKGISIEYVWEDKPLGTAGALSLVENFSTENILLMNSDLFTNVDFEDLYLGLINENADMAVASTEYKVDVPYAVFETNGPFVKNFKEKPSYIYHSNAGVYLFKKELIKEIPHNEFFDITDLMEKIINSEKRLIHKPIFGYWIDIGKPLDYKQAQDFVKHIS
ncbi:nucleotidyltransferase [Aquimarina aggregata]|uniref:Nucleotidyltransferase n=1 Tax=Aquimarina aggregata TaxID=1642818 RepID=A0A162FD16_9FLAO|nr:nucleotidyltransferase family protein [Aquimarina aggregata]KZS41446.1 nucleotidyltransferase [Aquimarina aggregata]